MKRRATVACLLVLALAATSVVGATLGTEVMWRNDATAAVDDLLFVDGAALGTAAFGSYYINRYDAVTGATTPLLADIPNVQSLVQHTHFGGHVFALVDTQQGCLVVKIEPHTGITDTVTTDAALCSPLRSNVVMLGVDPSLGVECVVSVINPTATGTIRGFQFSAGNAGTVWSTDVPQRVPLFDIVCGNTVLISRKWDITASSDDTVLLYGAADGRLIKSPPPKLPKLSAGMHYVSSSHFVFVSSDTGSNIMRVRVNLDKAVISLDVMSSLRFLLLADNVLFLAGGLAIYTIPDTMKQIDLKLLFVGTGTGAGVGGMHQAVDVKDHGLYLFVQDGAVTAVSAADLSKRTRVMCQECSSDTVVTPAGNLVFFFGSTSTTSVMAFDPKALQFVWGPVMAFAFSADLSAAPLVNEVLVKTATSVDLLRITDNPPPPTHPAAVTITARATPPPLILPSPWRTMPLGEKDQVVSSMACHAMTCAVTIIDPSGVVSVAIASDVGGTGTHPFPTPFGVSDAVAPIAVHPLAVPGTPTFGDKSVVFVVTDRDSIHVLLEGAHGSRVLAACSHTTVYGNATSVGLALFQCATGAVYLVQVDSSGNTTAVEVKLPDGATVAAFTASPKATQHFAYIGWRTAGSRVHVGTMIVGSTHAAITPISMWDGVASNTLTLIVGAEATPHRSLIALVDQGAVYVTQGADVWHMSVVAAAAWSVPAAATTNATIAVLLTGNQIQLRDMAGGEVLADGTATWTLQGVLLSTPAGTSITATFDDAYFIGTVSCGADCVFRFAFSRSHDGSLSFENATLARHNAQTVHSFCPEGTALSCLPVLKPSSGSSGSAVAVTKEGVGLAVPVSAVFTTTKTSAVAAVVGTADGITAYAPPTDAVPCFEVDLDTVIQVPVAQAGGAALILGETTAGDTHGVPAVVQVSAHGAVSRRVLSNCKSASVGPRSMSGDYVACVGANAELMLYHAVDKVGFAREIKIHGTARASMVLLSKTRRWFSTAPLASEDVAIVSAGTHVAVVDLTAQETKPVIVTDVGGTITTLAVDRAGRSALVLVGSGAALSIFAVDSSGLELRHLFRDGTPLPPQPLVAIGSGLTVAGASDYVVAVSGDATAVSRCDVHTGNTTTAASAVTKALRGAFGNESNAVVAAAEFPAHGLWPVLGSNGVLCVLVVDGPMWAQTPPRCRDLSGDGMAAHSAKCAAAVLTLSDDGVATVLLPSCVLVTVDIMASTPAGLERSPLDGAAFATHASVLPNNATALARGRDTMLYPFRVANLTVAAWALPQFASVTGAGNLVVAQASGVAGRVYINRWDASAFDAAAFAPAPVDGPASRLFPFVATLGDLPPSWRPTNPLSQWSGNDCPESGGVCVTGVVSGGFLSWAAPSLAGIQPTAKLKISSSNVNGAVDMTDVGCFESVSLENNSFVSWRVSSAATNTEALLLNDNTHLTVVGLDGLRLLNVIDRLQNLQLARTAVACGVGCLVGAPSSRLASLVLDGSAVRPSALASLPPLLRYLSISDADLSRVDLATVGRLRPPFGERGPPWTLRLTRSHLTGVVMRTVPRGVQELDLSGNSALASPPDQEAVTLHLCATYEGCEDVALSRVDLSGTGVTGWLDLATTNSSGIVPRLRFLSLADTQVGGSVDARGWASTVVPRDSTLHVNISGTAITAVVRDEAAALPAHLDIDVGNSTVDPAPRGWACRSTQAFSEKKNLPIALYAGPYDVVTFLVPRLVSDGTVDFARCELSIQQWAVTSGGGEYDDRPVAFFDRFMDKMLNCTASFETIVAREIGGNGYKLRGATVRRAKTGFVNFIAAVRFFFWKDGSDDRITIELSPDCGVSIAAESWCSVVSPTSTEASLRMQLQFGPAFTVLKAQRTGGMRDLSVVRAITMPSVRIGTVDLATWTWTRTTLFPASDVFRDPAVTALLNPTEAMPGPCSVSDGRVLQCDRYPFTFYTDCSGWTSIDTCPVPAAPVRDAWALTAQPKTDITSPVDVSLSAFKSVTWQSCAGAAARDRHPDGFLRLRSDRSAALRDGCVPLTTFLPPGFSNERGGGKLPVRLQSCADPGSINCFNTANDNTTGPPTCGRLGLQIGAQYTSCAMRGFDARFQVAAEVSPSGSNSSCVDDAPDAAVAHQRREMHNMVAKLAATQSPDSVYVRPFCSQHTLRLYTCAPDDTAQAPNALLYSIDTRKTCWPAPLDGTHGTLHLQCSPCLFYIDVTTFALPLWMLVFSSLKDVLFMVLGTLVLGSSRVRRLIASIKGGLFIRVLPYPNRGLHRRSAATPGMVYRFRDPDVIPTDHNDGGDSCQAAEDQGLTAEARETFLLQRLDAVNDDVDRRRDDLIRRLDPEPIPEIEFVNAFRLLCGVQAVDTVQTPKFQPQFSPTPTLPSLPFMAADSVGGFASESARDPRSSEKQGDGAEKSEAEAKTRTTGKTDQAVPSDRFDGLYGRTAHVQATPSVKSFSMPLLEAKGYAGVSSVEGASDSAGGGAAQLTFAAEDRFAALHIETPLYQALVKVVLMNRRHHIVNAAEPNVRAAWREFVEAFDAPDGDLRRCMELETHSRAHRIYCRYLPTTLRTLIPEISWLPRDFYPCDRRCQVSGPRIASEAEIEALEALDAVVEFDHCIAETAAIDRHFTPQPWMLALQTLYAAFLFVVCFARTLGRTYKSGWQHYEAFYFECINSCTSVGLLTNAMLRVWYTYEDTGQLGIFVWIAAALVAAPLVTHVLPAFFLFPWLPVLTVVFTAALFGVSKLMTYAAKRAPLQLLFTGVRHEARARKVCIIAGNVVSRLTATFAVTMMLQSLFNYFVVFNMRGEHNIDYVWPGFPGQNTVPAYEWESRDFACFFRVVWSSVQHDGLALKARVFSVFA